MNEAERWCRLGYGFVLEREGTTVTNKTKKIDRSKFNVFEYAEQLLHLISEKTKMYFLSTGHQIKKKHGLVY